MRTLLATAAMVCAALLVMSESNLAQDKKGEGKEVVLKGLVCCTKCELGKTTECGTVIQVKDKDKKETLYYFDAASHKKFHDDICSAAKSGTVTATVKDVEKKKVINVKKVTYDDK
jgi:hypothetical protein